MGKGFDAFMANPYWRGIYENAPSDYVREYYQIMFDTSSFVLGSEGTDGKGVERMQELLLDQADIQYLLEHTSMAQAKMHYQKCLDVLAKSEKGTCIYAYVLTGEIRNPWYTPPQRPDEEIRRRGREDGDAIQDVMQSK